MGSYEIRLHIIAIKRTIFGNRKIVASYDKVFVAFALSYEKALRTAQRFVINGGYPVYEDKGKGKYEYIVDGFTVKERSVG